MVVIKRSSLWVKDKVFMDHMLAPIKKWFNNYYSVLISF